MELTTIEIKNFRSIKNLKLPIVEINGSKTFSLLGINESGKSSFLNAINLYDEKNINYPFDYFDKDNSVEIIFHYKLNKVDIDSFWKTVKSEFKFSDPVIHVIKFDSVIVKVNFPIGDKEKTISEKYDFSTTLFDSHTQKEKEIVVKENKDDSSFDFENFIQQNFPKLSWKKSHTIIFWKSSPEYLILEEIDLNIFAENPEEHSVPLYNCFKLIDLKGDAIKNQIERLNNAVEILNLTSRLSDKVTEHIKTIWPDHPIKIKFQIDNKKISLLIEDEGVLYQAKTAGQRSDGFKQFVSFLLTLSAENNKEELSNTILLIDEPETHLHPPAQINLLNELIKITSNSNNNIVFFATHSNYMIDKSNIDRCYKVIKKENQFTALEKIKKKDSTYSEVNYEVFEISTNDYHNELYGYLEDVDNSELEGIKKDMSWKNEKSGKTETVSLAKYIRHSIHHPENTSNKKLPEADLQKSIEILRKLKYN
ncbi:MAG: hypothetical protein EOO99_11670 [Pedobacter sp.]|nr:MAG: hypothetical protein EOO99_11670 [Pedobacter sp.]